VILSVTKLYFLYDDTYSTAKMGCLIVYRLYPTQIFHPLSIINRPSSLSYPPQFSPLSHPHPLPHHPPHPPHPPIPPLL
jgi:hypothetical protein